MSLLPLGWRTERERERERTKTLADREKETCREIEL
jgi:hypothetical protein